MSIYRGKRGENPSQQPLPSKPECRMYVFGKPNGKIALGKGGRNDRGVFDAFLSSGAFISNKI